MPPPGHCYSRIFQFIVQLQIAPWTGTDACLPIWWLQQQIFVFVSVLVSSSQLTDQNGTFMIPLVVNEKMAPALRLLVYMLHPAKELVADSVRFSIEKCFKNKVRSTKNESCHINTNPLRTHSQQFHFFFILLFFSLFGLISFLYLHLASLPKGKSSKIKIYFSGNALLSNSTWFSKTILVSYIVWTVCFLTIKTCFSLIPLYNVILFFTLFFLQEKKWKRIIIILGFNFFIFPFFFS